MCLMTGSGTGAVSVTWLSDACWRVGPKKNQVTFLEVEEKKVKGLNIG